MDKTLVIIPFLPSEMQGHQLQLAVAGWGLHCQSPFHIVIVGEGLQPFEEAFAGLDYVSLLESKRVAEKAGEYRSHLDYVKCFRAVRRAFPDYDDGFIFVADDCFPVNDFTVNDVKRLMIQSYDFDGDVSNPYNGWVRDAGKTRQLLDREGLPHRNFTTHLPMWFEWKKWEAIVRKYDMAHTSYVIEAIYYNTYFPDAEAELLSHDRDGIRCWMRNAGVPPIDVHKAFSTKKFVCCAVNGYSFVIEDMLREHYENLKSAPAAEG